MDNFNRENFRAFFAAFMEQNQWAIRKVAAAIGCSEATIERLVTGATSPTDKMLIEGALLVEMGLDRYSRLTNAEREKISDTLGAAGGGAVGFASVTAAVGVLGTAGLSAAGISSGLATMGAVVGAGMAAGVAVAAAIPLTGIAVGVGVVQGVKHLVTEHRLNNKDIDPKWELLTKGDVSSVS
jgi:hypothetical protein